MMIQERFQVLNSSSKVNKYSYFMYYCMKIQWGCREHSWLGTRWKVAHLNAPHKDGIYCSDIFTV